MPMHNFDSTVLPNQHTNLLQLTVVVTSETHS
jgi:hypothetical protein